MKKKLNNKLHLWWVNTKTQKRTHAGVAYYNNEKGDYSLILNSLEISYKHKRPFELFLRPILTTSDSIYYRLEKVLICRGKTNRHTIGEAHFNRKAAGDVHICIEPYTNSEKKLVLTISNKKEEQLCA